MAYKLGWYAQDEVIYLGLEGTLSFEELKEINERMLAVLEDSPQKLALMLDVSELTAGYATVETLRMTQKYGDHQKLETIIGIANSKLNRLITLLTFNLCRAYFVQFDSQDKAQTYFSQKGVVKSPMSDQRNFTT
jgi:hypothetical protein